MLADGQVLAVGGDAEQQPGRAHHRQDVLATEIWNPATHALMQPEILILRSPMSCCRAQLGEAFGDALRHRDRARIGERAVVEARAGDDVGDLADIGLGETRPSRARARRRAGPRSATCGRTRFCSWLTRISPWRCVRDVCHAVHLRRAGVARRRAGRLQRRRDDGVARHAVRRDVVFQPQREVAVRRLSRSTSGRGRAAPQAGGAKWPRSLELVGGERDALGLVAGAYSASTSRAISWRRARAPGS